MKPAAIALILTVLVLSACAPQEPDVITIGVVGSFSGDSAMWGETLQRGVDMAAQELGETKYEYRVVYEDDAGDNTKSASAAQKLLNVDGAAALIGVNSGNGNAIAPIAEAAKAPFCVIASDPAIVKDRTYAFKHWTTPEAEAVRYLEEVRKLGYRNIVILETHHPGVDSAVSAIIKAAEGSDVTFVRVPIDADIKDARTDLTKLKNADFDAFLLVLLPSHLLPIAKQTRELGFEQPFTSIEVYEYISEGLDFFEGEWYITAAVPPQEFADRYAALYGVQPSAAAPNGYDCLKIIVRGFETDREDPMASITSLTGYDGATADGLFYRDGSIESPAAKKMVKDGAFVVALE